MCDDEGGEKFLHSKFGQYVAVVNQDGGGSSAAGTADADSPNNGANLQTCEKSYMVTKLVSSDNVCDRKRPQTGQQLNSKKRRLVL